MNNLPWLKGKDYPLLILPTMEMLEALGKPYVLENVMGARYRAKGLAKRGIEAHGLKAGWLCGTMFGLPFYRHRLFATNWFWLAPGHPKHRARIHPGRMLGGRAADIIVPASLATKRGGTLPHSYADNNRVMALGKWQGYGTTLEDGGRRLAAGIGHAKGWRLAAEAMGIDWCNRAELTQAIPPCYTFYIGSRLLEVLAFAKSEGQQRVAASAWG